MVNCCVLGCKNRSERKEPDSTFHSSCLVHNMYCNILYNKLTKEKKKNSWRKLCLWCDAYRILAVFPLPSKSHGILGNGVVNHLLAAGHEVTYVTPFPKEKTLSNLEQIDVSSSDQDVADLLDLQSIMDKKVELGNEDILHNIIQAATIKVLENQNLQNFLNDENRQFDAVITEWMFNEIYAGFAAVCNCPHIWFFPFEDASAVLRLIDEYPNPAYTPGLQLPRQLPYTFTQRVMSLWTHAKSAFKKNFQFMKSESAVYEKYFGPIVSKKGRHLPPYEEIAKNASLALINAHESFGLPLKRPFNQINIGGYHIDPDVKPLPEDLKKIMDNARHGVIYFSMGSNLQSKQMPEILKKDLLKMFGGLQQTVLWKFEESLPDLPKNLHILKWAPQPSILSHPNCILFITHGGLLSTTETVHFGVPAIGIPVFGDQFQNVDTASLKGYLKRVDLTYSLADDLRVAIDDILSNPSYTQKARELSRIYHDRPVAPGSELVHWVEHVVRTRGALHMRSPARLVPWYQKMYLDLIVLISCILLLVRAIFICLFESKKQKLQKKKKN